MELTLEQALQKGIEAHKAGKAQEADRYYTAILKAQPKHPDANHNMGVLAVGVGKVEEGLPFFKTALEANSSTAQFWLSYIDALITLDRIADAKSVFDQAKSKGAKGDGFDKLEERLDALTAALTNTIVETEQDPPQDQLQSLVNLYSQGKLQEALKQSKVLAGQYPNAITVFNIQGVVLQGLQQFDLSIEAFNKAISIKPDYADAYYNLGAVLKEYRKFEEAMEAYKKAISIKPDFAEAYNSLGIVLKAQGKIEGAIDAYTKALSIQPNFAAASYNMGLTFKEQGKLDEALEAYSKAISIDSDHAEAHNNMGNALREQGKLEEAIEAYKKVVVIKPDFAEAYSNMGNALKNQGKLNEAIEAYKKALTIKPDYADVYWNLSGTAADISESKNWVKKCLEADPKHLKAKLSLSALQFYEGDKSKFNEVLKSPLKNHALMRSFAWAFSLPKLPSLHFHRWALFDHMISLSKTDRPFYEFGVWRGEAFRYMIKTFKRGYGFDTFEGLPEDWHNEKTGTYSSDGNIPKIKGGKFIVGKFEDTLPGFFAEKKPMASIINFDADLYSSTICALNFAKPVIDQHTILIFDEFIINKNWEQDEYKALEEFCAKNHYTYEVLAISFFTKQVAVRIIGI